MNIHFIIPLQANVGTARDESTHEILWDSRVTRIKQIKKTLALIKLFYTLHLWDNTNKIRQWKRENVKIFLYSTLFGLGLQWPLYLLTRFTNIFFTMKLTLFLLSTCLYLCIAIPLVIEIVNKNSQNKKK